MISMRNTRLSRCAHVRGAADASLHDNRYPQIIRTERVSAKPREDDERDLMKDMLAPLKDADGEEDEE